MKKGGAKAAPAPAAKGKPMVAASKPAPRAAPPPAKAAPSKPAPAKAAPAPPKGKAPGSKAEDKLAAKYGLKSNAFDDDEEDDDDFSDLSDDAFPSDDDSEGEDAALRAARFGDESSGEEEDDDDEDDFEDDSEEEEDEEEMAPPAPKAKAATVAAGKKGALVAAPAAPAPAPAKGKVAPVEPSSEEEEDEDVPARGGKMALLSDSEGEDDDEEDGEEEEDDEEEDGSEGSDDDDSDALSDDFEVAGGDIIAAQARLQKIQARVAKESAEELAHAALDQERFHLPTPRELEAERAAPPNLPALKKRIEEVVAILTDFRRRRDPFRARSEYTEVLAQDITDYYGYNRELVDCFMGLFSPAEALQWFEANEAPRPVVIRVNTLKTRRRDLAQALINRGVSLDPLGNWTKVGLKVYNSTVPIGATPEYLAGHYMLQAASSFVPAMALDPRPGERVLDMCAAPGGKTTHLAQLMQNTGVLIANDFKRERLSSLQGNLARMGVTCAAVSNLDGRKIPELMKGFDRILLDAPCTGLGIIARDPSAKTQKGRQDIILMSHLQKQLILAAVDALDASSPTGGFLVYSTCSVTVEENEAVVNYVLRKRHVKLVPLFEEGQEDIGRPGMTSHALGVFHPSLRLTRRYYPHEHNMDGFYVAKLKKISDKVLDDKDDDDEGVAARGGAARGGAVVFGRPGGEGSDDEDGEDGSEGSDDDAPRKPKGRGVSPGGAAAAAIAAERIKKMQAAAAAKQAVRDRELAAAAAAAKAKAKAAAAGETVTAGTKRKRLPVELRTDAEVAMLTKGVEAAATAAAAAMRPAKKRKLDTAADEDDEEEDGGRRGGGAGGEVSFLRPGESLFKKKRKAGKKLAEARKAKAGPGGGKGGPGGKPFKGGAKGRNVPKADKNTA